MIGRDELTVPSLERTGPEYDIVVLGGGPAGVVTAIGLVRLGYKVAMLSAPRRFAALEGISARACRGLEHAGCTGALAEIGAEVPRVAYWNGQRSGHNSERVVERKSFDAALLRDAASAGVAVLRGRVRAAHAAGGGWQVRWRQDRPEYHITGGFLIDARGRGADRAHTGWTPGPPTVSLGGRWRFRGNVRPETGVTTYGWGWIWHALQADGSGAVQVFVSTRERKLPARPDLRAHYERLVRAATVLEERLATASRVGGVHARDAAMGLSTNLVSDRGARVGDAALAVDPLAGHGMFEAVSGALALVPVVNTLLRRPRDAALAQRFYREKLQNDFWRMARVGRDFYREEQRWCGSSFWSERRAWPDDEPAHESMSARPARIERRPVSDDGFVREREVVVTSDYPRGVWRVAGVPLAKLRNWTLNYEHLGWDTIARLAADRFKVPADAPRAALAWLQARGLLDPRFDVDEGGQNDGTG